MLQKIIKLDNTHNTPGRLPLRSAKLNRGLPIHLVIRAKLTRRGPCAEAAAAAGAGGGERRRRGAAHGQAGMK
jgi:hypothetical protein